MSEKVMNEKTASTSSHLIKALNSAVIQEIPSSVPEGMFGFNAVIKTDKTILKSSEFDFEFDIPFDDDSIPNEATISIYNLAKNTRNNFSRGNELTVTAGYGSDTGVVLKGKISKVKTKHDGCDVITTVYIMDNAAYEDITIVNRTFTENTKASYILKWLLDKLNLPIAVYKIQRDHTYEKTTAVDGSITEAIKNYADICGVSVYINKLQIYCRPIWDGDNIHFTVCADTGMLESPEPFEEEATNEEYQDNVTGYNINMLFQHRMTTAAIVDVSSKDYKGVYRVCGGEHHFDGLSATTKIKCIEKITTKIIELPKETSGDSENYSDGGSDIADSVISTAEAEIGTRETGDNDNKYGAELGNNRVPWCGIFVAWCLKHGGLGLPSFDYASALSFAYAAQKSGWGVYHAQGSGYSPKRGDIFVRNYDGSAHNGNGHVGFVRYDSDGNTFTTVEGNSDNKVNTRTLNNAGYTFVTPPYPKKSSGNKNIKWITGWEATVYGNTEEDDNGICGWNGLNYHRIDGCHVAIPTYCVKRASNYNSIFLKQDFPEFEGDYGLILEVRSPDTGKNCYAVVADCGSFGPHNKYNHKAALDLPPNTQKALGIPQTTVKIEYRVVGKMSSWNGTQAQIEENIEPDKPSVNEGLNILLNPGHGRMPNGYDCGAVGCGYEEADLTRELVRLVEKKLDGKVNLTVWDYEKDIVGYNPSIDYSSFDRCLSIHFNATPGAKGTLVMYNPKRGRDSFETALLDGVCAAGGFNKRDDLPRNILFTRSAPDNGTLLETCFIDSQSDMDKYQRNKDAVAQAIADAILNI